MIRNFRGYQIRSIQNGKVGCPGNFQGPMIFQVSKDGKDLFSTSTLRDAQTAIVSIAQRTEADRAKFIALRASLLNK